MIQIYKCIDCGKIFQITTSNLFDSICKNNLADESENEMSTHDCDKALDGLGHLKYVNSVYEK